MVQTPPRRLDPIRENPPKKYEDIINPEFYGPGSGELWRVLRDVVLFWIEQGVRIFE